MTESTNTPSLENLSAIAEDAYIYGFPALEMQRLRYNLIFSPRIRHRVPINEFRHGRSLATPHSKEVTAPNNDTLYSSAWLDLSHGPLRLKLPDAGDRYFSFAFMDFYTNVFEILGRRNAKAGDAFLITGSGWRGEPPPGARLVVSPTNGIWLLARIVVDGPADVPAVQAIQAGIELETADGEARTDRQGREGDAVDARTEPDVARLFGALNLVLVENPPPPEDAEALSRMATIGVGPGQTFRADTFSSAETEALSIGVRRARETIERFVLNDDGAERPRNGWTRPPADIGDYGVNYALRANVALVGIAALPPKEAIYFATEVDADGRLLDGANRYRLHFAKDELPPVGAFWSLTLYERDEHGRAWLVENRLGRYSIGDRTAGLRPNTDGALDIVVSRDEPPTDQGSNWLPSPAGRFHLSLRAYEPRLEMLDGTYQLPAVVRDSRP